MRYSPTDVISCVAKDGERRTVRKAGCFFLPLFAVILPLLCAENPLAFFSVTGGSIEKDMTPLVFLAHLLFLGIGDPINPAINFTSSQPSLVFAHLWLKERKGGEGNEL